MSEIPEALSAALADRYELTRQGGEGGMATVYMAEDLKHHRKVALKVMKPELAAVVGADRFLAEIETTANLQHPNILPLFDSGETDGFLFYVMPFVEGETLRERLDREKQLPLDDAIRIGMELADALDYAHRQGVIHRDIKPANVLLHEGRPLIADFGIALAVGAAGGARLTETGLSVGTPYYMSPEQATGDQVVGPASDTYALGCVLYEMLVGEPPYLGNTAQAVLGKIIAGAPISVTAQRRSIPPNVDAAIRCALEKLPADRHTSAHAFSQALADPAFRHGVTPAEEATGPLRAGGPLALSGWAAAAILAVAFGWAVTRPGPAKPLQRYALSLTSDDHGTLAFPAISSDGSLMVYSAVASGGPRQLWLRRMENLTATPVPGTDGGVFPAISPDGLEVAFMSGGQLKAAPLAGGVVRTLADSAVFGTRWEPDGWVYYTPIPPVGINRVPANGGAVEAVMRADSSGDGGHGELQVLPGGDDAVFTVWSNPIRIEGVRLATGERKVLTPGFKPYVTDTGHLVFATENGGLMAAAFDPEAVELTGAAVPLADGMYVDGNRYPHYALSRSGMLVYRTGSASTVSAEFVWVTRQGVVSPVEPGWTFDPGDANRSWALSPDGTRLALRARTEAGHDIWIKELEGGPLSRLTFDEAHDAKARWTPDGQSVTFLSNRGGNLDVWVKRADGIGEAELLLDHEENLAQGFWSPDGEWLILRVAGPAGQRGNRDILGYRPGTDSVAVPLLATEFDESAPSLSPDGRWIAYQSSETGIDEVFVRPFPDVNTGKWQISSGGGIAPLWAHNGHELFYRNGEGEMVAAQVDVGEGIRVVGREVLFEVAEDVLFGTITGMYDVTADDQRFLMVRVANRTGTSGDLVVVQNWLEEVKVRVGR